jgi:hypothetical protein
VPLLTCAVACLLYPSQEDEALRKQVARLGPRNWSLIAKAIPGRSGKSCRLRWVCRPTTDCGSRLHRSSIRAVDSILLCLKAYCMFRVSGVASVLLNCQHYGPDSSLEEYRCWPLQEVFSICLQLFGRAWAVTLLIAWVGLQLGLVAGNQQQGVTS